MFWACRAAIKHLEMNTAQAVPDQTRFRWFILFGVWLIYFSFGVAIASMAPMVAPISADLGAGNTLMGGILGAWPLAYIIAAIPCGILLDKFGVRPMLLVATLIMATSLFARSFADTPLQMMLAVALFGLGGPLISVGAPKTIANLFEGTQRATAMGIYVTGPYLGGIFALGLTNSVALPLAGGDWRGVMLIYGGLVLAAGMIWFAITCHREFSRQSTGSEQGKKFNLAAFRDILQLPEVRMILAMSIGIFFINHALNNWLPELLRDRGFTPVEAGLWAAIPSAMGVLGVLVIPRLATPDRRLAIMGTLFCMSFLASLLLQSNASAVLASGLVLQGLARGSMMTIAILILMETPNIPPERLGLAGGMFFTSAEIGGVLGPFSFGLLSDLSAGFEVPLFSISLISLLLLLVLFKLRKSQA